MSEEDGAGRELGVPVPRGEDDAPNGVVAGCDEGEAEWKDADAGVNL